MGQVIGKNILHFSSYDHFINEKILEFSNFTNIDFKINDSLNITDKFVGKNYGIPTNESLESLKILGRYEGIILDPIYSGKAFAALISDIKSKQISDDESVLFIHTGGLFNIFQYNKEIHNYLI